MMFAMPVVNATTVDSPVGPIGVFASRDGIVRVKFGRATAPSTATGDGRRHLERAIAELAEYFTAERTAFTVPLDWSLSHGWALSVRQRLYETVGYGETVSYGRLALLADRPDGARAVGGILAGNPIPVIVPCHRVISADGGLGGFAASGGAMVETKRKLLELEGSVPPTLF